MLSRQVDTLVLPGTPHCGAHGALPKLRLRMGVYILLTQYRCAAVQHDIFDSLSPQAGRGKQAGLRK